MGALREWVNIVKESLDGIYALGMEEFRQLLGFHLYFQSPGGGNGDLGGERGFINHEGVVIWTSSAVRS